MKIKASLTFIAEIGAIALFALFVALAFNKLFSGLWVFVVAFFVLLFTYYWFLSLMEKGDITKKVLRALTYGYMWLGGNGDVNWTVTIVGFLIGYSYILPVLGVIISLIISPITYNIQRFKKLNKTVEV